MIVYQRPAYLGFAIVICAFAAFAGVIAATGAIRGGSLWEGALFVVFTAVSVFAGYDYLRRLQSPRPLVTLSALGVTNEDGESFNWPQVSKIYKFTGVLFIRVGSKRDWVVRLDPAEIGRDQLSRAIEFIKAHAPGQLTERL